MHQHQHRRADRRRPFAALVATGLAMTCVLAPAAMARPIDSVGFEYGDSRAGAAGAEPSDAPGARHSMQPGVTIKPLALATFGESVRAGSGGIQLRTDGPKVMMTASIAVEPGGSFGWHSHPGPVQVAVKRGTFSLVRVENQRCRTRTFGPGDAFVENGGRVHLGHNEGPRPVRIFATFLAPAGTTDFSKDEETPEVCR
jgi:quercetin dioxygenase-like cupin family protein